MKGHELVQKGRMSRCECGHWYYFPAVQRTKTEALKKAKRAHRYHLDEVKKRRTDKVVFVGVRMRRRYNKSR